MGILNDIRAKAVKFQKTICLPEALDERTLRAAADCAKLGFGPIVLVGDTAKIQAKAGECGADISKAIIRDPASDSEYPRLVSTLVELRQAKGMTAEAAEKALKDGIMYAAMLVKLGLVDGYVSGAVHSTADTLRPALQVIKARKGVKTVSAFFMMALPESSPYQKIQPVLFFGDSGLVQNPTPEELADIAVGTAQSWKALIGSDPIVAMLSHSTKGSAKHADVDKVTAALALVRKNAPELEIDGELQGDAALIREVGASKAPGSKIPGRANVLIFPDLDAGNICYKLTERLAGATAIGPLISGMAKPVNDLSRGCKAEDIVDAIAVTCCQAAALS
ncbi:MAG: phosphate acetyltransferase [Planctomycetota bacterium]|jgi:phosphate acetyltransferase|nr:phosphate acetyltransferase [Planctomycetota bacterium]